MGDTVKLVTKNGDEFTQEISSMQIEHANIDIAKKGDEFGLKVNQEVKVNSSVFKVK